MLSSTITSAPCAPPPGEIGNLRRLGCGLSGVSPRVPGESRSHFSITSGSALKDARKARENADPSVQADIIKKLNQLIPAGAGYSHTEGNSDAHIKSALIGNSRTLLVQSGKLVLGSWEGIFFCEWDGPRRRKALVLIK